MSLTEDDPVAALPPQSSSAPPPHTLRRSGREHFLSGKYKDFKLVSKGLPVTKFADETTTHATARPEDPTAAPPLYSYQRSDTDEVQRLMLCDRGRLPRGKYSDTTDESPDTGIDTIKCCC